MKDEEIFRLCVREVQKMKEPVDIGLLSEKLKVSWWSVYRAICNELIRHIQVQHPEIFKELPLVPLKTRKGILLVPVALLGGEVKRVQQVDSVEK